MDMTLLIRCVTFTDTDHISEANEMIRHKSLFSWAEEWELKRLLEKREDYDQFVEEQFWAINQKMADNPLNWYWACSGPSNLKNV